MLYIPILSLPLRYTLFEENTGTVIIGKNIYCIEIVNECCCFPGGASGKDPSGHAGDSGDTRGSLVWEDPLEESMATLSSSLAWRIPWTEEHGGWWATVHGISESDTIEAT